MTIVLYFHIMWNGSYRSTIVIKIKSDQTKPPPNERDQIRDNLVLKTRLRGILRHIKKVKGEPSIVAAQNILPVLEQMDLPPVKKKKKNQL